MQLRVLNKGFGSMDLCRRNQCFHELLMCSSHSVHEHPLCFHLFFVCVCARGLHCTQKRACRPPFDSPIFLNRFLNCPCLFVVDAIICDWQEDGLRFRRAGASGCSLICICFTPSSNKWRESSNLPLISGVVVGEVDILSMLVLF